jgi:hypothetical protein
VEQRPGQGQLLLHALAPGPGRVLAPFPEPHLFQQLADARPPLGPGQAVGPGVELQVILGAQVLIDARVFQQGAGAGPDLVGLSARVITQHLGPPGVGFQQAQQQANGRRLACAVGTQEAKDGARRHLQRQAIHGADGLSAVLGMGPKVAGQVPPDE